MNKLAIFASGSGTNAQNIIEHFECKNNYQIQIVVTNKDNAYVLERAKRLGVKSVVMTKEQLTSEDVVKLMKSEKIDYIILAGYLLKIPEVLIKEYEEKIINIHPALLPKFGGKGMYGHHVHEAVVEAKESETGITIHLVDEQYDNGKILFQAKCKVEPQDTADIVAEKIHTLEQENFPRVIEDYLVARSLSNPLP